MSSVALLAGFVALLPLIGLATVAWFAIMHEAASVHSFDDGLKGMQFEE